MASVLLHSIAPSDDPTWPYPYDELNRMKRSAERDKYGVHQLTEDPDRADIILFVENCNTIRHYLNVRSHSFFVNHREKCFLFARHDHPIPFLPGVYASIPKRWYYRQRTRSGPYLKAFAHDFLAYDPEHDHRDYLFSFVGKMSTDSIRRELFQLDHPDQYLFDTTPFWPYGELEETQRTKLQQNYLDACQRSKFILCPRGEGTSSIRLFETMRIGRAPVIIADQWVAPEGPDWKAFSLQIAEKEVSKIPAILTEYEEKADRMGRKARSAWEDWFSEAATFHRVTEWCLDIMHERTLPERLLFFTVIPQLLQPLYFKSFVRAILPQRARTWLSS